MNITWHGHSTFEVEIGSTTLLIDPYFDNPHTSIDPYELDSPDFLLLTHGHMDHIADVPAFSDSTVIATPEVSVFVAKNFSASDSVYNFGMNMGGTICAGDAYVTMHGAAHTNEIGTSYGNRSFSASGGIPVSYTISDEDPSHDCSNDRKTFYHAGDTALMVEMRDIIAPYYAPTAAAIPIGGSFTMGPKQAAIAVDWLDADYVFPMHYDTAPPIEQDPKEFAEKVAQSEADSVVHVLQGDESFRL
jgi:L-ascorbate metabolism protein UlaG (beta-lactamase superfamily)